MCPYKFIAPIGLIVLYSLMPMFGKREVKKKTYDKENLCPVLKCSICTGEQVAGFKNIRFDERVLRKLM